VLSFGSRGGVDEEVLPAKAGVAFTTVRVEDPNGGPPPRRPEPVAGDDRLGLLADHVAAEPDPRPACQLEPQASRLGNGRREAVRIAPAGRLEQDQQHVRAPREGRQAVQPVGDLRDAVGAGEAARQIEEQDVDRAARQQRAADREGLVERFGCHDHQPFEPDAAGNRLDRIEAAREVHPGHDRAGGLGLGDGPQCERGAAARSIAAEGQAGVPWQAPRSEDRVELGEAGRDDAFERGEGRGFGRVRRRGRDQREGPLRQPPRSCRSPAGLEARQGRRHVRGSIRHATSIEQMFYFVNEVFGRSTRHNQVRTATMNPEARRNHAAFMGRLSGKT
jgi:hypothetical protein